MQCTYLSKPSGHMGESREVTIIFEMSPWAYLVANYP